jgi:two-component system OmpR family response regulator
LGARSSLTTEADHVDTGRSAVLHDVNADERRDGGVVVVRWPEEMRLLEHSVALGMPRLLLVEDGTEPPEVTDTLEDWIRLSADDRDRQARMATLRRRAGQGVVPVFDGMCRLGFGEAWAPLSPIEYRLAAELVGKFRRIVSNKELTVSAWGDSPPRPNALRVHLTRLRRRLEPIGLEILTIRCQGHIMQESGSPRSLTGSWPVVGPPADPGSSLAAQME